MNNSELFPEYRGMGTFLQRKRQNQALKKLKARGSQGKAGVPTPKKLSLRPAID